MCLVGGGSCTREFLLSSSYQELIYTVNDFWGGLIVLSLDLQQVMESAGTQDGKYLVKPYVSLGVENRFGFREAECVCPGFRGGGAQPSILHTDNSPLVPMIPR